MLRVDHASLRVASLDRAIAALDQSLGLVPTRSPRAPDRHSRLYFHRSYLEVSQGESPGLELYFFGFDDLPTLERDLTARGLRYHSEPYLGVDGAWDNLELQPPEGVPAPILVRRTQPPELAGANWPPPRAEAWPCGVRALRGLGLTVTALEEAVAFFGTLLDAEVAPLGGEGRVLRWPGGLLVLRPGTRAQLTGIVLEVASLEETARALSARGTSTSPAELGGQAALHLVGAALPGLQTTFVSGGFR